MHFVRLALRLTLNGQTLWIACATPTSSQATRRQRLSASGTWEIKRLIPHPRPARGLRRVLIRSRNLLHPSVHRHSIHTHLPTPHQDIQGHLPTRHPMPRQSARPTRSGPDSMFKAQHEHLGAEFVIDYIKQNNPCSLYYRRSAKRKVSSITLPWYIISRLVNRFWEIGSLHRK